MSHLTKSDTLGIKSVFMSAEIKEKWLSALRSGEYQQGRKALCDGNGGYCCLGVLQMVVSGKCEREALHPGNYERVPTMAWLDANNIKFMYPMPVGQELWVDSEYRRSPFIRMQENISGTRCSTVVNVTALNDDGYDFLEIADILETAIEII
jgi:hypothetical protein